METSTSFNRFYFNIIVRTKFGNGEMVEEYKWNDLPWHTRIRFDWYFLYRAALLQVKYPRLHVETRWGTEETDINIEEVRLKNKISSKKRKITEIENRLMNAREAWVQLFPIEDDELYKQALHKTDQLKLDLLMLQSQQVINNV